jgi:copper transport protein
MSGRRTFGSWFRWLVVLFLLGAPFLVPASAQAHALLDSSTPADGASYDRSPSEVRMVFSEPVQVAATSVHLFDGDGHPVEVEVPLAEGGAADAAVVRVPLTTLPKGRYLLRWRTISSDDLHPTAGSIVFGIGIGVAPGNDQTSSGWDLAGGVAEAVVRWVALTALGFALGALVLSLRLGNKAKGDHTYSPVLPRATVAATAVGAVAVSALALLFVARIVLVSGSFPVIAAWQFTLRWVVAIVAAGGAWLLLRDRTASASVVPSVIPVVLLVVSLSALTSTSHPTSAGAAAAVLGAVHTVTTMLWACGAAAVAAVAIPALRRHDRQRAVLVSQSFTPIALVMVPVSLVTGLLLAGRLLPSVGALLNTDYGHTLLVKLALLALGLLFALGTVLLLVVGGGRRRAAAIVGMEAIVLGTVVLAASTLAATHPASAVVWAPASGQIPTAGVLSQLANDLVVTVDVGPGRPGRNFVTIGVLDTRRPAPAPVSAVRLAAGSDAPIAAVPQGHFQWLAVASIADEGPMDMRVAVDRPGEPTEIVPFTWTAGPPLGTRLGGVALAPIAQAASAAVALVGLLGLALYAFVGARRRPPRTAVPPMHTTSGKVPVP